MEKEITIEACIDFYIHLIELTKKNELFWININTLTENYDLGKLINEGKNGVIKYKASFNDAEIIFSYTYKETDKIFNFEIFPSGSQSFYRIPVKSPQINSFLEELLEYINKQIKDRNSEIVSKYISFE